MGLAYWLRRPRALGRLLQAGPIVTRGVLALRPAIVHLIAERDYDELFRALGRRPIHALFSFWWTLEPAQILAFDQRTGRRFPQVHRHYLANTSADADALRAAGLDAHFINHNAFVDEHLFAPRPAEARYDAVYDAVLAPYKRHALAAAVPRLALIGGVHPDPAHLPYARALQELLPGAAWLNAPLTPQARQLSSAEVARTLNQARCGLCLSAAEGAMYASIQYLLAGLPVVTTPSLGGRDAFFHPSFTYVSAPEPAAVAAQVARALAAHHDPAAIRATTLAEIHRHRERFCRLGQSIYAEAGVSANFTADFARVFYNKLLRPAPAYPATARLWWRLRPLRLARPSWR